MKYLGLYQNIKEKFFTEQLPMAFFTILCFQTYSYYAIGIPVVIFIILS